MQPRTARTLVGDETDVRRGVRLADADSKPFFKRVSQHLPERLARYDRHGQRRRGPLLTGFLQHRGQKARRADEPSCAQVKDRLYLDLQISDTGRDHHTAECIERAVEHLARRREVVREAVDRNVTAPESCCM